MNQKGFVKIIILIGVGIVIGAVGTLIAIKPAIAPTPSASPFAQVSQSTSPIATPIQIPLTSEAPLPQKINITKKLGETEGSFLIQKIEPNSVEGLLYRQYPVANSQGIPWSLRIGDDIGDACAGVSEKLVSIDYSAQTITFTKTVGDLPVGGCPI